MRVIDLLNKIANGEKLPEKIKVMGDIYYLCEGDQSGSCYFSEKQGFGGIKLRFDTSVMNKEIEIIEDKKIEKLYLNDEYLFSNNLSKEFTREDRRLLDSNFKELGNKINAIIDVINKGDSNV